MQEINLYSLIKFYAKNWLVIVIFIIVGLIVGVVYNSFIQTPQYKSTATIFITGSNQSAINKDSTIINNNLELMTSRRVLEPVIDELKLNKDYNQLVRAITSTNQKDTSVIKVTVSTDNPESSKTIANSTITSFKKVIKDLNGGENVQIIDMADLPNTAYNVRKVLQLLLAVGASVISAIIVLFFIYDYKNSASTSNPAKPKTTKAKKNTKKDSSVANRVSNNQISKKNVKAKKK